MDKSQKDSTKDFLDQEASLDDVSVEGLKSMPTEKKGLLYLNSFLKNLNGHTQVKSKEKE
jgi:hypothetical protein